MSRVNGSYCCVLGRPVSGHRAFSLIEVLIGIVVLALGLVGLAAVFPTVVRQQQVASDQASAVSAIKSAMASLKENADLSRPVTDAGLDSGGYPYSAQTLPSAGFLPTDLVGWSVLTWDDMWSRDLSWVLPTSADPASSAIAGVNIDPATGEYVIGKQRPDYAQISKDGVRVIDPRSIRLGGVTIPMKDRLIPEARPGLPKASQPRFVWDFVTRRVDEGDPHLTSPTLSSFRDDGVQVAIFVRRIDPGIRVAPGLEVSDVIGVTGSPSRVAVAAAPNDSPTLDGMGGDGTTPKYSMIQRLTFTFANINSALRYDVLDITGPLPLLPYAAQVGQLFVDQFGVVHKVVEVQDAAVAGTRRVRLDEAFREDYVNTPPTSASRMTVIFTPQIPASVDVFTISPSRQKPQ